MNQTPTRASSTYQLRHVLQILFQGALVRRPNWVLKETGSDDSVIFIILIDLFGECSLKAIPDRGVFITTDLQEPKPRNELGSQDHR